MKEQTQVILDVDTGTDDAVAIILAALRPEIDLRACTTVWGNLGVEGTTQNTLQVLTHIGASGVPVYKGRDAPIVPIPDGAWQRTGESSGMHPEDLGLAPAAAAAAMGDAPHRIVSMVRDSEKPLTLVAVAPLTNIAAALVIDPDITSKVEKLVIMGGAHEFGNVTPAAEANIWHDPCAAEIVLHAGFEKIVLVPLDATHKALITREQTEQLAALRTPAASAAARFIEQRIRAHDAGQPQPIPHSAAVHDALCIACLSEPEMLRTEEVYVTVETAGFSSFGRTVMDTRSRSGKPPNVEVAFSADGDSFFEYMKETLSREI